MTITQLTSEPAARSLVAPPCELIITPHLEGNTCVLQVTGELDLATRNQLFTASTAGNHLTTMIDLADVAVMDCSGFGALVASRLAVEGEGRTLDIRGATRQPAHLLELIAELERTPRAAA